MELLRPELPLSEVHRSQGLVCRENDLSTIRNEAQLIDSILAGNTSLYHDLLQPYEKLVYRMAFMMLRNEADAEDASQEAFLRAYRNLASFRSESKFSTWLTSIALNEARARLRYRKGGLAVSLDSFSNQTTSLPAQYVCDKQESALQSLERAELRAQLERAISDLPVIYREVLLMRLIDERSVRSTAQALMSTEGLVKTRLHRGRRMLQRRLSAHRLKQRPSNTAVLLEDALPATSFFADD
jgi:RNA polymerase sigma-70 factor, ECF subfamily